MPRRLLLLALLGACARELDLPADPGELPLEVNLDRLSPAVLRPGAEVQVEFTGSRELESCQAQVAGRGASCESPAQGRCSCRLRLGAELGEGQLEVIARGGGGGQSAEATGQVFLDPTPPAVDGALGTVLRRAMGTDDAFRLAAGGAVDAGLAYEGRGVAAIRLWSSGEGGAPLLEAGVAPDGSLAEIALPGTAARSPARIWISAVDVPGNESARVPAGGADVEPPLVEPALVTATLPSTGPDSVAGEAGAVADLQGVVREVRVYGQAAGGEPLATLAPTAGGAFSATLGETPHEDLFVEAEDKSGNVSPRVRTGREVLTLDPIGRREHDDTSAPAALYAFAAPEPLASAPGLGPMLAGEASASDTALAASADGASLVTTATGAGGDPGFSGPVRLAPTPAQQAALFELPGEGLVLERGQVAGQPAFESWRFDGERFVYENELGAPSNPDGPPAPTLLESRTFVLGNSVYAYDRGRFGQGYLWRRGPEYWDILSYITGPYDIDYQGYGVATDVARQRAVLVGHYYFNAGGVAVANDVWLCNGSSWTWVTPSPSLEMREGFSLAWHDALGGVVLFGGTGLLGPDPTTTWLWNGKTWTKIGDAGPPVRRGAAMAYDSSRKVMLLFGGRTARGAPLGDTWILDANGWRELEVDGPPPRWDGHLAHDPTSKRMILHGGSFSSAESTLPSTGALGDTWAFDGTTWEKLAEVPEVECGQSLAYDVRRGRAVLFGGSQGSCDSDASYRPSLLRGTWELDGEVWTRRDPVSSPPPRIHAAMAYDSWRGVVVLFGGDATFEGDCGEGTRDCADTWEYDGDVWRKIPVEGPSPRTGAAMTFDATRGLVLMQGGTTRATGERRSDLWAYDGSWRRLDVGGSPGPRSHHVLAYDAHLDRTLSYGSNARGIFAWDGGGWSAAPDEGMPLATDCPDGLGCWAGAYDAVGGELLVLDPTSFGARLHRYDGARFEGAVFTGIDVRGGATAYDPRRRRLVTHGARGRHAGLTWAMANDTPRASTAALAVRFRIDRTARLASVAPLYTGDGSGAEGAAPPLLHLWSFATRAWVPAGDAQSPAPPAGEPTDFARDGTVWLLVTAPGPSAVEPAGTPSVLRTDAVALQLVVAQ